MSTTIAPPDTDIRRRARLMLDLLDAAHALALPMPRDVDVSSTGDAVRATFRSRYDVEAWAGWCETTIEDRTVTDGTIVHSADADMFGETVHLLAFTKAGA